MFGLITGSGFYDIPDLDERAVEPVETPYGAVALTTGRWRGEDVVFLPRHSADHSIPPHAIDYRANIWALHRVGARSVLATAVSGGIDPDLRPGRLVLISDFLDFTSGRATTFFDGVTDPGFSHSSGSVTHTDMTTPYDPAMRAVIRRAAEAESIDLVDGGVYCTTNGPRFETPAEIEMMRAVGGDLVGMTGYPEVALAAEAALPYAAIGIISNPAAGMGAGKLAASDIVAVIEQVADPLYRLIGRVIELSRVGSTE
ncbi:MAG: S-methyl-5'-thioinosine phosphorylase [Acidimicrobiia bacterium]|nr:S-methyl-5'-thioinosine phosphorylase [Acidimicrobiia bacterium]